MADPDRAEVWRPVVGYAGTYEVSNTGLVRRASRGKNIAPGGILKPATRHHGYQSVKLHRDGAEFNARVHRLVLEAFVGPAPEGADACHNDGDPKNNHVDNLRWDTHSANMQDSIRHKRNSRLNRTHCPNGHPLEEPNLVAAMRPRRTCLSCDRERAWSRYRGVPFRVARADARFAALEGADL